MNLQPYLESELLVLRPMETGDLESLFRVASDPLIWEQHHSRRFRRDEFELFFTESMASGGALVIIDKITGQIIGSSRYSLIPGVSHMVEIGWSFLSRAYWGGKYNRDCKKLMIDHAFDTKDGVVFFVHETNLRSQKAVQKIGGKRTNELTHPELMVKGESHFVYLIERGQL